MHLVRGSRLARAGPCPEDNFNLAKWDQTVRIKESRSTYTLALTREAVVGAEAATNFNALNCRLTR